MRWLVLFGLLPSELSITQVLRCCLLLACVLAGRLHRTKAYKTGAVRYQFGFLYESYHPSVWWFETVDILVKFAMTALIVVVPRGAQFPFGMCVTVCYYLAQLLVNPYVSRSNAVLHLLAQADLFLIQLAGHIAFSRPTASNAAIDALVTLVLLLSALAFCSLFAVQSLRLARALSPRFARRVRACRRRYLPCCPKCCSIAPKPSPLTIKQQLAQESM